MLEYVGLRNVCRTVIHLGSGRCIKIVLIFRDVYYMENDDSLLSVRPATMSDIPALLDIFAHARQFMVDNGNPTQWGNSYPELGLVESDVAAGHCYVVVHRSLGPVGTFCLIEGDDPTYVVIEDGRWLDDDAYATIHRLASRGVCGGVADTAVEWSIARCGNIRIDTHADNAPMLGFLRKAGFVRCGIIYCHNGTPRIAFQRHDRVAR